MCILLYMGYNNISTAYDVFKEELIQGAELDGKYGIPMLRPVQLKVDKVVDFQEGIARSFKKPREHGLHFFIDDARYERFWNTPEKYFNILKNFQCVMQPDFTIDVNSPKALQIYNKYRNHALAFWLQREGIKVIPKADLFATEKMWDFCFDGLPKNSVLCASTNGRVKSREARQQFCKAFAKMESVLQPTLVYLVGREVPELQTNVPVVYFKSRSQMIGEKYGNT